MAMRICSNLSRHRRRPQLSPKDKIDRDEEAKVMKRWLRQSRPTEER
jgi:hypothetical protein